MYNLNVSTNPIGEVLDLHYEMVCAPFRCSEEDEVSTSYGGEYVAPEDRQGHRSSIFDYLGPLSPFAIDPGNMVMEAIGANDTIASLNPTSQLGYIYDNYIDVEDDEATTFATSPGSRHSGSGEGNGGGGADVFSQWGDWLDQQRQAFQGLITQYKTEFPKYLDSLKTSSYEELEGNTDDYGRNYDIDLWKRGLGESEGFLAGGDIATEGYYQQGSRRIESMLAEKELQSLTSLMSALGNPSESFATLASGYTQLEQMNMSQEMARVQYEWYTNFQAELANANS